MKSITIIAVTLLAIAAACTSKKESNENHEHTPAPAEQQAVDTIKKSIPKEEHAMIGDAHITIKYHAPAVRGRQIWGGLVPYGDVWVTGAHRATSFEINKDFIINGKTIPAGKYALFTIPGKDEWVFIINKKWDQHLADDYAQADDIIRIQIKPEILDTTQERLKYSITSTTDKEVTLTIAWEKVKLTVPFSIQ
jgi:hypothetical protein